MRIIVTGAKGQLGTDLVAEIQSKHPEDTVLGIDRAECDITDKDAVMKVIKELKPDAVIHLAAYTAVDKAEADPLTCDLINVQGTNYLVEAAKAVGAKFLYISTDYVFDGEKEGAYEVEDIKNPLSIYGQTKSEAEDVVVAYPKHFIVRISWAFGVHGSNFPHTMLKLAQTHKVIRVVNDQVGSPTFTEDISVLIDSMIHTNKYGTYQATNEGYTNWYHYTEDVFHQAGIKDVTIVPISAKEYGAAAQRPQNSRLSKKSLDEAGFKRLPPWEDALARYLTELKVQEPALFPHEGTESQLDPKTPSKAYIVTGANGFIGHAMTKKLLAKGHKVYAFVTEAEPMNDLRCDHLILLQGFFGDYDRLFSEIHEPIDCLFHFAWKGVHGDAFKNYRDQLDDASFAGDTLRNAIKIHCRKFVLASSINTLETKKYFYDQEAKPRYTNIYGTAKLAAEMVCKTLAYQEHIEFNCGVIAMAYGEGNFSKMVPNVFITSLLKGVTPKLIEGKDLYDIIYIGDIVNAFYAMAVSGVNMKTYYVGHQELKTFKEWFSEVRDIVKPGAEIAFGAYPTDNHIDYEHIDIQELTRDTGYRASSDFAAGIKSTAAWLAKNMERF
ncbi:MAG: dTDP-4-dehydrorhamnose reductase [bacterium ADurb.BinA186]|nr:MAG: dTDP-4-dehydrorhamnose reductase [bacterium ADurb.BinA186]